MENNKIIAELNSIKNNGNIKDISKLVSFLNHNDDEVKTLALNILSDIKYNNAVDVILNEIKNTDDDYIKTQLVSVCWQSGLDFSKAFDLFIDTAINGSLELCIESLSAVEDIIYHKKHTKENINNALNTLNKNLPVNSREKNELLTSLKELLEDNL